MNYHTIKPAGHNILEGVQFYELKKNQMSFDDNILLKLRRQYSGKEKYRLFLQQLNRLEQELMDERKKNIELLKQQQAAENTITVEQLAELEAYRNKATNKNKFVSMKAFNRAVERSAMWEKRFWELHAQLNKQTESK